MMFRLFNCMSSPSMGTIRTHIIAPPGCNGGISHRSCVGVSGVISFPLGCISYVTALISIVFKYEIMIGQKQTKNVFKRRPETHFKWKLYGALYFEVTRVVVGNLVSSYFIHGELFCL